MYKNPKDLLIDATKFPAAVEAALPEGAPKISTMLLDAAGKLPVELPDFLMEVPELPAPPELPELPAMLGGVGLRSPQFVTGARVTPVGASARVPVGAALVRTPAALGSAAKILTPEGVEIFSSIT